MSDVNPADALHDNLVALTSTWAVTGHQTMSRRQRRRRQRSEYPDPLATPRPWYFRYGYHIGVWSGAALGVIWYLAFRDMVGLVIGVVLGQAAGITLGRMGRNR